MSKTHRAVFLDRDGVLTQVVMRGGVASCAWKLDELQFVEEAKAEVLRLKKEGFLLFVFTNQPDIARGFLEARELGLMHDKLSEWLGPGIIEKVYFCPHDNHDRCECRKPKPGMILRAAEEFRLECSKSFVIGDREADVSAGRAAGCRAVLIDTDYNQNKEADYRAKNIQDAVQWILNGD